MSMLELPSGLRDRVFGARPAGREVDAATRRLERALSRLEPDPLFRRRLRGDVVNYHVASREGLVRRSRRSGRQMGAIGRSVLYASLTLALGVTAVGAASQHSLPGDGLYAVKLRLEEIRMQIAPPSVRDDLARMALAERTSELQALAASGSWNLVADAARRVTVAEAALLEIEPGVPHPTAAHAEAVMVDVLASAPAAARDGLERAIEGGTGASGANGQHKPQAPSGSDKAAASPRPASSPPTRPESGGSKGRATTH